MRLLRSVTVFITLLPLTERFFGLASTQLIGPGPRRPSIIMRPGMRALAPGEERYTVAGDGAIAVPSFGWIRLPSLPMRIGHTLITLVAFLSAWSRCRCCRVRVTAFINRLHIG
jgi:hypothetical protein